MSMQSKVSSYFTKCTDRGTIGNTRQADTDNSADPVILDSDEGQKHSNHECISDESSEDEVEQEPSTSSGAVIRCCQCPCCRNELHQPYDQKTLAKSIRWYGKGAKKKKRSVQTTWYKRHPWLSVCSENGKAFCNICMTANTKNMLTFSTKMEQAFVSSGFDNWKKSEERFKRHEKSGGHQEAVLKITAFRSKQPDVHAQVNSQKEKEQQKNRKVFLIELSCIRVLARQGLALRGHEEVEGNLPQLMKAQGAHDTDIKNWMNDGSYMSHDSVNEIIGIMGNTVVRNISKQIQGAGIYSLLADETRDISNKEQLVVCIRWVDSAFIVYEEPISMFHVPKTDAATILKAIKDVLLRCGLPIEKCRGQGYDGASNMMGRLNGVATKISEEEPRALKVHCLAHCTNLVLQDACKKIKSIRDALDITKDISRFIKWSPKREVQFVVNQIDASGHLESGEAPVIGPSIKPLCTTRWTVRTKAIDAVLKNYAVLKDTMREVNETQHDDNGALAGGILARMEKFETYWGLKLAHLVFSAAEELSRSLQGKDTSAQEAHLACRSVREYYRKLRDDELEFEHLYSETVKMAAELDIEPQLPRHCKRPRRYDDGAEAHRFQEPREMHRQEYIEVLELIINQLEARFDQQSFKVVCEIEDLLIAAAKESSSQLILPECLKMYANDIDLTKLESQLKILPHYMQAANDQLKNVTSVRSIADALNASEIGMNMLSEVATLLKIYLTVPITTATAERSFSVLRQLKTWLRSTMSQKRLNNLLVLHCHKGLTDDLSLKHIAENFATANDRRRSFFGSFL